MKLFIANCVLAAYFFGTASALVTRGVAVDRPNTIYMDADDMLYLRENQDEIADAVDDIVSRAKTYIKKELQTVHDKGEAPPFEGAFLNDYCAAPCLDEELCIDAANTADDLTRHELLVDSYFKKSLTEYQFERLSKDFDPTTVKKCYEADVYMKCDGDVNEHGSLKHDKDARSTMLSAIYSGTMAFWYTGDEEYAEMASMWLKAWFGNSKPRMNPRMT
ncbi:hypothetical protein, variant [Sphaeroforma arctica JP610]|uniref:Alginate lyase domain-containing protein n=1 Tax=Sphaeroforma arctica JP610 TaxID=667725 RepID=A0A0L0FKT7_9EUKA|nr:hypothetical protein, variant [Sphaeroforma arctica JP610]KNC77061.1 hypothetical protein, variant [Sphaeroforma arctica JP610]|eukprot:XP_014150963.1 hypothetical protein, variant [Sphaeroforma arctica JP610]